jgi:hypothetical protein
VAKIGDVTEAGIQRFQSGRHAPIVSGPYGTRPIDTAWARV